MSQKLEVFRFLRHNNLDYSSQKLFCNTSAFGAGMVQVGANKANFIRTLYGTNWIQGCADIYQSTLSFYPTLINSA